MVECLGSWIWGPNRPQHTIVEQNIAKFNHCLDINHMLQEIWGRSKNP
jgi:hypothetical protein